MKTVFFLFFVTLAGNHLAQAQTDFSPERLPDFRKLTENRVADFQEYLSIITDKNRSMEDRKEAVELAEGLFIEGAKIQVTGKSNAIRRIPVRPYLNRLLGLAKYEDVQILNKDIMVLTDFQKGNNGNYRAIATCFHKFEGFDAAGKPIYADKTRLTVSVETRPSDEYRVYLGDIYLR